MGTVDAFSIPLHFRLFHKAPFFVYTAKYRAKSLFFFFYSTPMKLLAHWIVSALLFLAIANIVPGIHLRDFGTAIWAAFFWGILGVTLRPVLLFFTLPVNILTLGLFTFVVNGFLFWLLAELLEGFRVDSFGAAFFGALLFSLFNWAFGLVFQRGEERIER